jgi:hypothetical protein
MPTTCPPAESPDQQEQAHTALLRIFTQTLQRFFGGWAALFAPVHDPREPNYSTYPLSGLLCTGVLMYLFRLGARREIQHQLRDNGPSQSKFAAWFAVAKVPHGDTLNYTFKKLDVDEVQEVVCRMVARLIRHKVLARWRLYGHYTLAVDGSGELTFTERHCAHCLTRKLTHGGTLYYHPVLEAKLVTPNGFAFSLMTEFIENTDPTADKQDCELKAFYRLAARLKARFPRLRVCLLLDGLFACGPVFQLCHAHHWKYLAVLKDKALVNLHRSYAVVLARVPENHKHMRSGPQLATTQTYRWANGLDYYDSADRRHRVSVLTCQETTPAHNRRHQWVTNFTVHMNNVDVLANQGGRLRWKIENEGFNIQKNGGFKLEHAYSRDPNARKVFYLLLQVAYTLFQLLEKGSLFRMAFPTGVGSLKNIAARLLEAWRNLRISATGFKRLYGGRYQIRFDSS